MVKTHISAFVKNCAEKEVKYLTNSRCEVIVEASLNGEGSLSHIIYDNLSVVDESGEADENKVIDAVVAKKPEEDTVTVETVKAEAKEAPEEPEEQKADDGSDTGKVETAISEVADKKDEVAETAKLEDKEEPAKQLPTYVSGLIINAKETLAKPAMNPSIISDTGEKLYNVAIPDRAFRMKQGLASYTAEVGTAEDNRRVTKTPYVIKAIKVVQENPCIIMVSQSEFDRFMKIRGSGIALERCRVIIVVGK